MNGADLVNSETDYKQLAEMAALLAKSAKARGADSIGAALTDKLDRTTWLAEHCTNEDCVMRAMASSARTMK